MVGALQSRSMSPCPYPDAFLDSQRQRLLAARGRLRAQSAAVAASLASRPAADERRAYAAPAPRFSAVEAATDRALAAAGRPFSLSPNELGTGLGASAAEVLGAVDAALARLAADRYGWDGAAGAWIAADRLRALPSASAHLPQSSPGPMEAK